MPWKEQLLETPRSSMTGSQLARGSTEFVKSDQKSLHTCVTESAAGRLELSS